MANRPASTGVIQQIHASHKSVAQARETPSLARRACEIAAFSALLLAGSAFAQAPAPLHARIDEQIAQGHAGPLSPPASDADFVRRIYLDLTGMVPTAGQVRAFLADASPDKRVKLIDQLLASPYYPRHMATVFDVMWMERRRDQHVKDPEWQKYLLDSFAANKPYDQLVREVLTSDGSDPATRPAAKFVLDREAEPNLLARDVGRIFFGKDLQCAQCHDHPLIDDYYQADYHGLLAFFSRTTLFVGKDDKKKNLPAVLMDAAEGEVNFQSVFDPAAKGNTLPKVPGGKQVEEPRFKPSEAYVVAPAKEVRHVPKYSRRAQLAAQIGPQNRAFNRNIVNRLWAQMMGRGLVEPVDLHHSANPPTHPQLLEMLADEFVALKYDIRAFLRELALSQTYQRSIDLPADAAAQGTTLAAQVPALEQQQQQLAASAAATTQAASQALGEVGTARKTLPPIFDELTKAAQPIGDAQKAVDAASKAAADATAALTPKQDAAKVVGEAAAKAKEAAAKLPDEKDLAEAAAKFETKAAALNGEVQTLAKAADEKNAAAKAAADKLAELHAAVEGIHVKIDAARKQVIALEEQFEAAAAKSAADLASAAAGQRKASEAKSLVELANLTAAAAASKQAADKLAADVSAAKATLAKLTADLPGLQAAQTAAQKANDEAAAAATTAKTQFETKQAAAKEFADVLAKADEAAKKLPGDAELAATVQKLKTRSEQLTGELAAVQKDFATKDDGAKAAAAQLAAATQAAATATAQIAELTAKTPAMEQQVGPAGEKAAADQAAAARASEAIPESWSKEFAAGRLKQLSPEQFGWSLLVTTGVYQNYVIAASAELDKAKPLSEEAKKDPAQMASRQQELEAAVYAKLEGNVKQFVGLYGNGAGSPQTDFFATIDQALFLANGGTVKGWLAPSGENLTARLLKLDDPKLLAEEMYLSIFARPPSAAEVNEVTQYLASRPNERPQVVQEMAWALLSSTEFRFNH
ncbi:MAG TPA: DUF1549 domain-containing protein [Pirellulaceae bacterium]|nr:DUF1549 domain-containing protein [Pirellulaceae bacterium]